MHAISRFFISLVLSVSLGFMSVAGCTLNSNEDESVDHNTAPQPPTTLGEIEWVDYGPPPAAGPPITSVDCKIVDCRSGFHCVEDGPRKGQCVSLCNPGCMAPTSCIQCGEAWDCKTSAQTALCGAPPAKGGNVAPEEPVDDQVETW
jgi:hypothetical protein